MNFLKKITIISLLISSSYLSAQEGNKTKSMEVSPALMDNFLKKKSEYNTENTMAYCIQLYNGNEARAKAIIKSYTSLYPEAKISLRYEQPEWKPQTGVYLSKREADLALKALKAETQQAFPDALVVPHKFD